jgi:hypothetical protein
MADTPTTQQNNTSHGQSMSPPCCPPAAPLLPATIQCGNKEERLNIRRVKPFEE